MSGEMLKEFLVGIEYKVGEAAERRAKSSVADMTTAIVQLGRAAIDMARMMLDAANRTGAALDQLYWSSQRVKSSAENIRAFGFAMSQMGSTAEAARGSMENLARFLRNTGPGGGGLLASLGIRQEDNGRLRDTADIMRDLGERFRQMPYHVANAYAGVLGIDENTLRGMIQGVGEFSEQYRGWARAAGVDLQQAAEDGRGLMQELRGLGAVMGLLGDKVTSGVARRFGEDIRRMRQAIVDNMEAISGAIEWAIRAFLEFATMAGRLAARAGELLRDLSAWFAGLDADTQKWAKGLAVLTAGWIAFNFALARSPVGMVLSLAAALLALYDDYKTFREGGNSLIDWERWEPAIAVLASIVRGINDAVQATVGWEGVLSGLLAFVVGRWAIGMIAAFARVGTASMAALLAPFARLPAAALSALGLGALGGVIAAMVPSSTQTDEHEEAERARVGAQPSAQQQFGSRGEQALAFFRSRGWTAAQAAGIVANLAAESNFDPRAVGDGGRARGIAQWHPDRQANFEKAFGKPFSQATYEDQLAFVDWELRNTERRAGALLRAVDDAAMAGGVVSREYERPADREGEARRRGEEARRWMQRGAGGDAAARIQGMLQAVPATPLGMGGAPMLPPGGASVSITQNNEITVNGSSDPARASQEVGRERERVDADLLRNMTGAVR